MKIYRSMFTGLFVGIAALAVSSCAYDPYYSGSSYSSGGGYGSGYGYGSSNFSTSFFVSTGNPRWGYDPYAGAYYDYSRRCYYDPYLSGYYPVGYRPRYVYGSPHPHGWSRGRSSIAPPSRIRSYKLTNYQDRTSRYRSLGRDWSRDVRKSPAHSIRDQRPTSNNRSSYRGEDFGGGRDNISPGQNRGNRFGDTRFNRNSDDADRSRGGRGFRGNTSVTVPPSPPVNRREDNLGRRRAVQSQAARQQVMDLRMNEARIQGRNRAMRQIAPQVQPSPQPQVTPNGRRGSDSAPANNEGRSRGGRGVRGLGEG